MTFKLHPQLEKDCFIIGNFPFCQLLLNKNKTLPWFILVPRQNNIREAYELNLKQQQSLTHESNHLGQIIMREFNGDKLNVAALGNIVPQLHIHHIVRHTHDPAWPKPIWGNLNEKTYSNDEAPFVIKKTQKLFIDTELEFTPC